MADQPFSFRPLSASDKEAVLAISAKIWEGDDYVPSSFDAWIADPDGVLNGCFQGERLVGFGRVGFVAPGHAWLEGLRKDPDSGARGVGRALCLEGLRYLSGRPGLRSIRFTAYAHNPETIAINEAIGFRRVGTLSIKSKRLPGSADGKEAFGAPAVYGGRLAVRRAGPIAEGPDGFRAAALERLAQAGWFDGFRIESWKAYPLPDAPALRPDDIVLELPGSGGRPGGLLVGSLDQLKRQANIAALTADGDEEAAALCAAFEAEVRAAGYSYIEVVAPRRGALLKNLDACGYVSWETEDDFLVYEWPAERLRSLPSA